MHFKTSVQLKMSSHLKIVLLTCLLSLVVLLGEVKPVSGRGLAPKVKKLEKSVSELKQKMEEQEEIIKEQNETIKELKGEMKEQEQIMKEQNETINELKEEMKEQEQIMKEQNETINELKVEIKEQNEINKGQSEAIKEQEGVIKEQNETIKELKEEIIEQDASMKEQEERIETLEECKACSKIKELNKTLHELEEKIPEPDIDECATDTDNCDANAFCTNTYGSYICTCNDGYLGDGKKCTDIDECATNTDSCDDNAVCTNSLGSYTCTCKAGYSGDGKKCTEIDECVRGGNDCHNFASCTNTIGSYTCSCNPPFTGDGKNCMHTATECQNYQRLTNADRNVNNHHLGRCDLELGPGWFRFQGAAGNRMATSCPPIHTCGTSLTGWLNGGHPTVADGQVTRQVCFHWTSGCCELSSNIQVRNCGIFYVYYFHGTPGCDVGYCGTD